MDREDELRAQLRRIGAQRAEIVKRLEDMRPHGPWRELPGVREWREWSSAQKRLRLKLGQELHAVETALDALGRAR